VRNDFQKLQTVRGSVGEFDADSGSITSNNVAGERYLLGLDTFTNGYSHLTTFADRQFFPDREKTPAEAYVRN
jgi:hypothetical protein